ncbi:radical SAM protein [Candidatus Poribacteria bacterium]|nr:radical SAM protein [Candidatus Poribacteria bacterium]
MEHVAREHRVRGFNVYDNLFGLNSEHARAVCAEIRRRRLDVTWECWTAGNLVDDELAAAMKASGCVRVGFGAESGDDAVLGLAQRGFTSEEHAHGIRALKSSKLYVSAFFMVGLPGESDESVRRTVEFAKRCGADEVTLSLHRPFPGTSVWRQPDAFGTRITQGAHFEAYVETEQLSRTAILDAATRGRRAETKRRTHRIPALRPLRVGDQRLTFPAARSRSPDTTATLVVRQRDGSGGTNG